MSASVRTPDVPRLMTFVTGYARVVAVVGIRVLLRRYLCSAASNVIIENPIRADGMSDEKLQPMICSSYLRKHHEVQPEVQIQSPRVNRGAPPGPEYAHGGNGRRG